MGEAADVNALLRTSVLSFSQFSGDYVHVSG
jgi:hypothetical protein